MKRMLGWLSLVFLCCAAGGDGGVEPTDARLLEAQTAFDESKKLQAESKYAEAISKAEHALALREAVLGGVHPEVAASLHRLGNLYLDQGEYARAEPLYQRALAIREQTLSPHHPDVATTLNGLAILYASQALYPRAESFFQRALAIREQALGKQDPAVTDSLNNLASLYLEQGLYSRAEPLYERALAIREQVLGKDDPRVADSLNNLAVLYMEQGFYDRAEPLHQRSLAIREHSLGKDHPDVAVALNNLAILYVEQGLYSRAEPFYQRALALKEATFGKDHPDVAVMLTNLGDLYRKQGLYSQARPLWQRALAIQEATIPQHSATFRSLSKLADVDREQGLYSRAEPLYQRALVGMEATLGEHHFILAQVLSQFARLRIAQGRVGEALPLLRRAFSLSEQRLRQEALDFSESRLASFLQMLREEEERLYALVRAYPRNDSVQRMVLAAVLLRKGRSVEEITNTSRAVMLSLGPQERDTFERLRGLRTQLASLSLQGPDGLAPAEYQKRLKDLTDQSDVIEADLASRSAPLRALSALPSAEDVIGQVSAALPKDGALVEFVAYVDRPLVPKPGTPESKVPSELRYLALVLFPDGRIHTVDLGPATPIDSAVSVLREAFAKQDAAYLAPAQELYARAFKPVRAVLGTTRRLFLSPDGQLSLVPFAALHDGKGFLIDSFDFSYLTSGKDLLRRTEEPAASTAVVVMADPSFSSAPAPSEAPAAQSSAEPSVLTQRSYSLERFFSTLRSEVSEYPWPPLPGTRQEAEAIHRLLPQAQLFLGPEASKQRLIELHTPAVLHIATHGFFLENEATPADSRALGASGNPGPLVRRPADPLLRSGLVLAGAHAPAGSAPAGSDTPRLDSTLVTALELAGLNLWGTQLVVLSACDTGRGDVKLGQGVYGLRRALVVAGAQTVVMSLWKVNDDSTRLLMESYYQNLLAGQGRAAALQNAMLTVRQSLPHPYSWAPFISLGSDAPVHSLNASPPMLP